MSFRKPLSHYSVSHLIVLSLVGRPILLGPKLEASCCALLNSTFLTLFISLMSDGCQDDQVSPCVSTMPVSVVFVHHSVRPLPQGVSFGIYHHGSARNDPPIVVLETLQPSMQRTIALKSY